jgi:hypothetical protein
VSRREVPGRIRAAAASGAIALAAYGVAIAASPGEAYWINDCGNKALVAQRLLETRFREAAFDHPGATLDPTGRWFPIPPPFAMARGGGFVSTYPLAYPALAALGFASMGPRGLRAPAALGGALAVALFAWWSALALGAPAAFAAATSLGLGTPLFFYTVTVWEHSLTLALALGAFVLLSRESGRRWFLAGALVGLASWLREELVLLGLAVLCVALARRQPLRLQAAFAAGAALPVAALLLFNAAFYGHALGGHVAATLGSSSASSVFAAHARADRMAAVPGLLGGFGHDAGERLAFALLGVGLPLAGAIAPRHLREGRVLGPGLAAAGLAAWGVAVFRMLGGSAPLRELVLHNGLLLQCPLFALAGLGARRLLEDPRCDAIRTAALAGALSAALTVAAGVLLPSGFGVQSGAGVHWGPRVLIPALPAFVLFAWLACLGRPTAPRLALGALVLAGLASTGLSLWFLVHQKLDGARLAERLRALPPRVLLTHHPLLAQHLAGLWREKTILLGTDVASLRDAAEAIARGGHGAFLFVASPGAPVASWLPGSRCALELAFRDTRLHYLELDVLRCGFEAEAHPATGADR